jgi:acyl phosphate:glycerol-3-phosphate acyltransferase
VPSLAHFLTALCAYLCGSIPTGYLVARARGVDIRAHGSGNIGATNVFRILGKGPGIFVLLVDALKGALPVLFLPGWIGNADGSAAIPFEMIAALGAVLGHNFTCWLRFKGGKGIATSAGVLAAMVPVPFLITLGVFLAVLGISRFVSLASVLAAAVLPFAVAFTPPGDRRLVLLTGVMAVLAIVRHKANIVRLLNGTERRLGQPRTTEATTP